MHLMRKEAFLILCHLAVGPNLSSFTIIHAASFEPDKADNECDGIDFGQGKFKGIVGRVV